MEGAVPHPRPARMRPSPRTDERGETTLRAELPRQANSGGIARRMLEEKLEGRVEDEILGEAKLVASELVDNAYQHGKGRIELRMQLYKELIRIEVIDEGRDAVIQIREATLEDGGYGLQVVEKLSAAWGAQGGTTHVWADLEFER